MSSFCTADSAPILSHVPAGVVNSEGKLLNPLTPYAQATRYFQVPISKQGLKQALAPLPLIARSCILTYISSLQFEKPEAILPFTFPLYVTYHSEK